MMLIDIYQTDNLLSKFVLAWIRLLQNEMESVFSIMFFVCLQKSVNSAMIKQFLNLYDMYIDYSIKRYCNNTSKFKKSGKLIQCNYAQFLQGQSHIYINLLKSEFCMIIFHDYGLIAIPHMYISYNSQSFTSQIFVVFTKKSMPYGLCSYISVLKYVPL